MRSPSKLSEAQKAKLAGLYGELTSTQSQLDAIADAGEQRIADQRAAAAEERERKAEANRERLERIERRREAAEQREHERMRGIRESAAKAAERRADLFAKGGLGQANTREELRRQALRGVRKAGTGRAGFGLERADRLQDAFLRSQGYDPADFGHSSYERRWERSRGETFTLQQIQRSQFDFMTELRQLVSQLGGNLLAAAAGDPRMYGELKEQTAVFRDLASNARGPGTRYAKNEIDAAFVGATF